MLEKENNILTIPLLNKYNNFDKNTKKSCALVEGKVSSTIMKSEGNKVFNCETCPEYKNKLICYKCSDDCHKICKKIEYNATIIPKFTCYCGENFHLLKKNFYEEISNSENKDVVPTVLNKKSSYTKFSNETNLNDNYNKDNNLYVSAINNNDIKQVYELNEYICNGYLSTNLTNNYCLYEKKGNNLNLNDLFNINVGKCYFCSIFCNTNIDRDVSSYDKLIDQNFKVIEDSDANSCKCNSIEHNKEINILEFIKNLIKMEVSVNFSVQSNEIKINNSKSLNIVNNEINNRYCDNSNKFVKSQKQNEYFYNNNSFDNDNNLNTDSNNINNIKQKNNICIYKILMFVITNKKLVNILQQAKTNLINKKIKYEETFFNLIDVYDQLANYVDLIDLSSNLNIVKIISFDNRLYESLFKDINKQEKNIDIKLKYMYCFLRLHRKLILKNNIIHNYISFPLDDNNITPFHRKLLFDFLFDCDDIKDNYYLSNTFKNILITSNIKNVEEQDFKNIDYSYNSTTSNNTDNYENDSLSSYVSCFFGDKINKSLLDVIKDILLSNLNYSMTENLSIVFLEYLKTISLIVQNFNISNVINYYFKAIIRNLDCIISYLKFDANIKQEIQNSLLKTVENFIYSFINRIDDSVYEEWISRNFGQAFYTTKNNEKKLLIHYPQKKLCFKNNEINCSLFNIFLTINYKTKGQDFNIKNTLEVFKKKNNYKYEISLKEKIISYFFTEDNIDHEIFKQFEKNKKYGKSNTKYICLNKKLLTLCGFTTSNASEKILKNVYNKNITNFKNTKNLNLNIVDRYLSFVLNIFCDENNNCSNLELSNYSNDYINNTENYKIILDKLVCKNNKSSESFFRDKYFSNIIVQLNFINSFEIFEEEEILSYYNKLLILTKNLIVNTNYEIKFSLIFFSDYVIDTLWNNCNSINIFDIVSQIYISLLSSFENKNKIYINPLHFGGKIKKISKLINNNFSKMVLKNNYNKINNSSNNKVYKIEDSKENYTKTTLNFFKFVYYVIKFSENKVSTILLQKILPDLLIFIKDNDIILSVFLDEIIINGLNKMIVVVKNLEESHLHNKLKYHDFYDIKIFDYMHILNNFSIDTEKTDNNNNNYYIKSNYLQSLINNIEANIKNNNTSKYFKSNYKYINMDIKNIFVYLFRIFGLLKADTLALLSSFLKDNSLNLFSYNKFKNFSLCKINDVVISSLFLAFTKLFYIKELDFPFILSKDLTIEKLNKYQRDYNCFPCYGDIMTEESILNITNILINNLQHFKINCIWINYQNKNFNQTYNYFISNVLSPTIKTFFTVSFYLKSYTLKVKLNLYFLLIAFINCFLVLFECSIKFDNLTKEIEYYSDKDNNNNIKSENNYIFIASDIMLNCSLCIDKYLCFNFNKDKLDEFFKNNEENIINFENIIDFKLLCSKINICSNNIQKFFIKIMSLYCIRNTLLETDINIVNLDIYKIFDNYISNMYKYSELEIVDDYIILSSKIYIKNNQVNTYIKYLEYEKNLKESHVLKLFFDLNSNNLQIKEYEKYSCGDHISNQTYYFMKESLIMSIINIIISCFSNKYKINKDNKILKKNKLIKDYFRKFSAKINILINYLVQLFSIDPSFCQEIIKNNCTSEDQKLIFIYVSRSIEYYLQLHTISLNTISNKDESLNKTVISLTEFTRLFCENHNNYFQRKVFKSQIYKICTSYIEYILNFIDYFKKKEKSVFYFKNKKTKFIENKDIININDNYDIFNIDTKHLFDPKLFYEPIIKIFYNFLIENLQGEPENINYFISYIINEDNYIISKKEIDLYKDYISSNITLNNIDIFKKKIIDKDLNNKLITKSNSIIIESNGINEKITKENLEFNSILNKKISFVDLNYSLMIEIPNNAEKMFMFEKFLYLISFLYTNAISKDDFMKYSKKNEDNSRGNFLCYVEKNLILKFDYRLLESVIKNCYIEVCNNFFNNVEKEKNCKISNNLNDNNIIELNILNKIKIDKNNKYNHLNLITMFKKGLDTNINYCFLNDKNKYAFKLLLTLGVFIFSISKEYDGDSKAKSLMKKLVNIHQNKTTEDDTSLIFKELFSFYFKLIKCVEINYINSKITNDSDSSEYNEIEEMQIKTDDIFVSDIKKLQILNKKVNILDLDNQEIQPSYILNKNKTITKSYKDGEINNYLSNNMEAIKEVESCKENRTVQGSNQDFTIKNSVMNKTKFKKKLKTEKEGSLNLNNNLKNEINDIQNSNEIKENEIKKENLYQFFFIITRESLYLDDELDFNDIAKKCPYNYTAKLNNLILIAKDLKMIQAYRKKIESCNSTVTEFMSKFPYNYIKFISIVITICINISLQWELTDKNYNNLNYNYRNSWPYYLNIAHIVILFFSLLNLYIFSYIKNSIDEDRRYSHNKSIKNKLFFLLKILTSKNRYLLLYFNFIFGCLALISKKFIFCYALQLFTIIFMISIMQTAVISIKLKYKSFLAVLILIVIFITIFSSIAFYFKRELFNYDDNVNENLCHNYLHCFFSQLTIGLRMGGGIVENMGIKSWNDPNYWFTFIYGYIFFFIIILLMLNIINGVIVDTFQDINNKTNENENRKLNNCFICDLPREEFETIMLDFSRHQKVYHNYKNYIYYMIKLKTMDNRDFNSNDNYVFNNMQKLNARFFPIKKSIEIEFKQKKLNFK